MCRQFRSLHKRMQNSDASHDASRSGPAATGEQAFSVFGTAAFSRTAGGVLFYNDRPNPFVELYVDGDGVADGVFRMDGLIGQTVSDSVL